MFWKRPIKRTIPILTAALLLTLGAAACTTAIGPAAGDVNTGDVNTGEAATNAAAANEAKTDEVARPAGWSEETHSNDVEPNYAVVFPQDEVKTITFTVTADVWATMQENMTELFGEPGTGNRGPGGMPGGVPPEGFEPPADGEFPEGFEPPAPGELPEGFEPPASGWPGGGPGGGPGFGGDFATEKPVWVTATVEFEGNTWTQVGLRYKGNSSLRGPWQSGSLKLPFKLDFDEFEDEYPEIDNQRFYGFKQLSLANNFSDNSFMRDALTYDVLEEAGLVAGETAFYQVILDYGEGPVTLGMYTLVEVIDDTVVERSFGDDSGNIYEADGPAATLAEGTFDQIETSFEKENNDDEPDWSDIETLYTVLHSEQRTTDPAAWRAELESVFDVDTFLEWLAVSALVGHWDTYGAMTHNYYLYNNPDTGLLTWISWDHNMTMGGGMGRGIGGGMGGGMPGGMPREMPEGMADRMAEGRGRGGPGRSATLDKANVGDDWPLIRYLLDDPTYYAAYIDYAAETVATVYLPDEQAAKIQAWAELLAPYADQELGADTYAAAIEQLTNFAYTSIEAANTFLNEAQAAQ